MVNWVIIVLAILCIYILTKVSHLRHKFFTIFVIILIFLAFGAVSIFNSNNKLNLNTVEGAITAGKLYVIWLGNAFDNVKTLTGKAVQMEWTVTNKTLVDKSATKPVQTKSTSRFFG